MKVIFLDIDGVLNNSQDFGDSSKCKKSWMAICPDKLDRLNRLIEFSGYKVVLSSSWRTAQDEKEELNRRGVTWISTTRIDFHYRKRAIEIMEWLILNNPKEFIILDDDPSPQQYPFLAPFHVLTTFCNGFTEEKLEEAIKIIKLNAKKL